MARSDIILVNRHLRDLNPLTAGSENHEPTQRFGPAVRKYTLLHYVISGRGTFLARGGTHHVGPGQAFLILPGEETTYFADPEDPWYYQWLGFDGELAGDFAQLPPVFSVPEDAIKRVFRQGDGSALQEYRMASALFLLYCELFSQRNHSNDHVRRVQNYIQTSYDQKMTVERIADQIGLDRRYLSSLFKKKTGYTIQEFIVKVRLEESLRFLKQGYSVQEAAQLSGYEDISNYSKMFKKKYGQSPAAWRKENLLPGAD